ncbi:hypothetical protein [Rugamonas sp. DEMB1]|uniref:hypothetical protein n=1 Tax=Rugamonas sp. DEMB1 TaxID=3039386 RepID=UPI00244A5FD2|nr:hypothetical protein [Rugamonas sp. DEMB1]WGG49870.1 hypothetical protein QC826_25850 [Rugamonas sp. DEMB1]
MSAGVFTSAAATHTTTGTPHEHIHSTPERHRLRRLDRQRRRPSLGARPATATLAATSTNSAATPAARADNRYLAQVDAEARAARLSKVDYALQFTLSGKESFAGSSTVGFDLSDASAPLTLDLDQASITSLLVNGKAVAPQYNGSFITLAPHGPAPGPQQRGGGL